MKIGIIGANGFIGGAIYDRLKKEHWVIKIDRYYSMDEEIDIIVDANGNSKKYMAERDPLFDFKDSVESVYRSLLKYPCKKYVYISSIDAEEDKTAYGLHRQLAEKLVKTYSDEWLIIRPCSVISKHAVKGVVSDIAMGRKTYVNQDSLLQLIPVGVMADVLATVIFNYRSDILRFYSRGSISVREIYKAFGETVKEHSETRFEYYNYPSSLFDFKEPLTYLKQEFNERMV